MTREELQKRYAEYERKLDDLKEAAPENPICEMDTAGRNLIAVYITKHDELEITKRHSNGNVMGAVTLSGDEAEKLYHFLGGLYKDAIAELESRPRWETPEQRERRTGEKWPDNAAVYFNSWFPASDFKYVPGIWQLMELKLASLAAERLNFEKVKTAIVCATEAGPPPDGWRPE
ncbi:MAG: hypothetical protein LBK27_05605 [Treponema sp.]|jgi:hypothetical protein|nr:hypothetical protein [Treponema sp.]